MVGVATYMFTFYKLSHPEGFFMPFSQTCENEQKKLIKV